MGVDVSDKSMNTIIFEFKEDDIPWQDGRFLYNLWQQKSYGGKLPARSNFVPLEIKRVLPNIMLINVEQNPLKVSMRLVGSFITNIVKQDPTGESFQNILERFQWLVKNKKPYFIAKIVPEWAPVDYRHYNILALPLAED